MKLCVDDLYFSQCQLISNCLFAPRNSGGFTWLQFYSVSLHFFSTKKDTTKEILHHFEFIYYGAWST